MISSVNVPAPGSIGKPPFRRLDAVFGSTQLDLLERYILRLLPHNVLGSLAAIPLSKTSHLPSPHINRRVSIHRPDDKASHLPSFTTRLMAEFRQSPATPPLRLSMQEDSDAIYMLPEQYPVTTSQTSHREQRRSYPRQYLSGTGPTNERVQQSSNDLGLHAPNLAVPSNAGYPMFDGQPTSLFQHRYAHLLTLDDYSDFFSSRSNSFPQMTAFATASGQGWPTGPVATQFSASSMPNHFSFQPSSINSTPPQTWPASTSGMFNDSGLPCFTSIGDEPSYHALLSGNFGGTSDIYAAQSILPGPSTLPQLHAHRTFTASSTQPLLTDLPLPPQSGSGSISYSRPVSPTLSYSPSPGEDHKPTHARRPAKLNLFNLSSVPELQNLALSIQGEAWFLNGEEERVISEREAERNLGVAGHSIFIAFLQEVVDIHTKRKTGWECRICRAANDAGAGDRYEVE